MRTVGLLLFAVLFAGCATTPVHLRHASGTVAQCGPYSVVGSQKFTAPVFERGCVEDYQRQGYERVP